SRIQLLEFRRVVSLARPADRRQVGVVVQTEILERTEQAALERIPEPELHGDVVVEVMKDVLGVRSFWRGGQSKKDLGSEMVQQPAIRWRRSMVELVDDQDVERRRVERV